MAELTEARRPIAMTIAGSDSGGGAGVQADLKTFAAMGVYGASVLTAITAQNTMQVTAVHEVPVDIIAAQIQAVLSDMGANAVKTGMLSSSNIIGAVAEELKAAGVERLVVDPVMVAKSGDSLLRSDAVDALCGLLLPLATVVTPNIPEAEVLTGTSIESRDDARQAAKAIHHMGPRIVVVKGGHLTGDPTDLFYDGDGFRELHAPRIDTKNTHGTGCTFASAIAAGLAKGLEPWDSVVQAKTFITEAIQHAYPVGQGHGPVNHFYRWG